KPPSSSQETQGTIPDVAGEWRKARRPADKPEWRPRRVWEQRRAVLLCSRQPRRAPYQATRSTRRSSSGYFSYDSESQPGSPLSPRPLTADTATQTASPSAQVIEHAVNSLAAAARGHGESAHQQQHGERERCVKGRRLSKIAICLILKLKLQYAYLPFCVSRGKL
uniref:Uncharacterized protein n=1 Tax=Neogobius melanostomus TaxID=47308 RepID=A0A8C6ULE5_9GOBI